jgi:hypothetical protein
MKKYFYVYYSYEEFGRGYIGKRECKCLPEEDVKYFGSFRDKTFKPTQKIILKVFSSRKEAMEAEIKLHNFYEVHKNPHFANKAKATSTGFYVCMEGENNPMTKMKGEKSPFYGRKLSKEQREKLKQSHKNRIMSEEHKKNIGKSKIGNKNMLGKKHTEESKKLMSEKAKGRTMSEETKKKLSEIKKGTIVSEETKIKLREARKRNPRSTMLGKKHTEEWKKEHSKKMKENNPFKGKKHTEETKKIISQKAKGRVAPNKGKPHSEETKRKISEIRKKQYEMKKLQLQQGGNQS